MLPVSVQLNSVGRDFGNFTALHDIDLLIEAGEFVSLLGPSGCGKTTTLRLIAGFDAPTRGRIKIGGGDVTDIPPYRRNLGMVFQNYALFPHMTVSENIGFGLRMHGISKSEISAKVSRMLDMIHLSQHGDRMPSQLSGGQQQRVAIARSLVTEPSVLLLDEPMGALDKNLRQTMQLELRAIQQKFHITTILVTHDQDEALTMSDKVVVMEKGYIRQIGAPEDIYQRPNCSFVANFLGASNDLHGFVSGANSNGQSTIDLTIPGIEQIRTVADKQSLNGEIILSIRPEKISLLRTPERQRANDVALAGTVVSHVFRGAYHDYMVQISPDTPPIIVSQHADKSSASAVWSTGDQVWVCWSAEAHTIFAANT